jgi:hypothetical protein
MASIAVTSSLSGPDKLMHREHILDTVSSEYINALHVLLLNQ